MFELHVCIIEGRKIEVELSASEANICILSRDSQQPVIAKPQAEGAVFKHVRCSDSSNGTCIQVEQYLTSSGRSI